jgi:hypothetical protein
MVVEAEQAAPTQSLFPWLLRSSRLSFGLAALLIVLVRNGFSSYDATEPLLHYAREFPRPGPSYKSSAILGPALAHALGLHTPRGWTLLHAVLSAAAMGVAVWLTCRTAGDQRSRRVTLVWLALAPGATCLLQLIGHYDVFVLLGATLLGFARGAGTALIGGALVGATNPGQGCILLLAYACVACALGRPVWRASWAFGAGCAVCAAAVAAWQWSLDVAITSRVSLLLPNLGRGLRGTLIAGTMASYAWYGLAWPLVVAAIVGLRHERRARALLTLGLVVIPAFSSMLTLDGTRVFVCAAWAGSAVCSQTSRSSASVGSAVCRYRS